MHSYTAPRAITNGDAVVTAVPSPNDISMWPTRQPEPDQGPYPTRAQADLDLHAYSQRVQAQLRANMGFEPWC